MPNEAHNERIVDQFTRQATPFSTASPITDANALRMIVEAADPRPSDTVLDVACGGGIVVCAFAPHVGQATGVDMTPAMLDRARQLATEKGIANVTWDRGDVGRLPYDDGAFDIVVTRFSMHHFLDPLAVMREMVRVMPLPTLSDIVNTASRVPSGESAPPAVPTRSTRSPA